MASLNSFNLVFRRSLGDFRLILAILSGMIVATTLISSAPIYMDSMDQQGITKKIDKVVQNKIIRVAVPNRNAYIILNVDVVLGNAVTHAPAEKDADIVSLKLVAAHHRPLRAAPRM